jgi:hypothetical protein
MSRTYFILVLSFFMFSCLNKEDPNRSFEKSEEIIGSWQFYEFTYSIGGSKTSRERVGNDDIFLTFSEDGSLESSGYFECGQAGYRIEKNILDVDFECDQGEESRKYSLSWEGEKLVFFALSPTACIEDCTHIFRKQELN